ncbi:MAG: hypothetical protein KA745_00385 [Gemmatimonadales bacterium]|nr:hypothetical protein [Gemmatimonadales bacterium]
MRKVVALSAGLFVLAPAIHAVEQRPLTEAKGIVLQVAINDAKPVTLALRNRVARAKLVTGLDLGFVTTLDGDELQVRVVELHPNLPPDESRELGRLHLVPGDVGELEAGEISMQMTWLGLADIQTGDSALGPCYECCLTCDGIQYCACLVSTSCGSCCCRDCCGLAGPRAQW